MPQVMEYAEEESERELTEQERLQRMGQFEMALTDKIGRVEKEEEYYHVSVPKPCVPMVLVLQIDNQMDKFLGKNWFRDFFSQSLQERKFGLLTLPLTLIYFFIHVNVNTCQWLVTLVTLK